MSARIIDGKGIAAALRAELSSEVAEFVRSTGVTPQLAAVLVGDDPASAIYVRNKQRACEAAGIRSTLHRLSADATQGDLLGVIRELNADASVHGILVQCAAAADCRDGGAGRGGSAQGRGRLPPGERRPHRAGAARFLPCTPAGCQVLLQQSGCKIAGAHAVVLGRSEIVGKPMAPLLMQKGADATVTVCHSRTRDVAEIVRSADIVIAAIGRPLFVTGDMVKPGAFVIDVGINRLEGGRVVGDVDFDAVREKAAALTPVPGGVGPMTIAMLLRNTLTAARLLTDPRAQTPR